MCLRAFPFWKDKFNGSENPELCTNPLITRDQWICVLPNNPKERTGYHVARCFSISFRSAHSIRKSLSILSRKLLKELSCPHKHKAPFGALFSWCGQRESNSRLHIGSVLFYHYTMPAFAIFYFLRTTSIIALIRRNKVTPKVFLPFDTTLR